MCVCWTSLEDESGSKDCNRQSSIGSLWATFGEVHIVLALRERLRYESVLFRLFDEGLVS